MALSQKHRSRIFQKLHPILGEEETEALLSHFPSRDLDEPVTKEFVQAQVADVRAEMAGIRAEIADLRAEFAELGAEFAELGADVEGRISALELRVKDYVGRRIAAATAFLAVLVTVFGVID